MHKTSQEKREYARQYHAANRSAILERQRQRRSSPQERQKNRERSKAWRLAHPERQKQYDPEVKRVYDLKKLYGITVDQYDAMLAAQGGKCAICGGPPRGSRGKRFHVDHDHVTGRVRGLLCGHCNHGIGKFRDSPLLLEKVVAYLRRS